MKMVKDSFPQYLPSWRHLYLVVNHPFSQNFTNNNTKLRLDSSHARLFCLL